jgi:hypothetical protein
MVEAYIILFIDLVDYSTNNEPIQLDFFRKFQKEMYHILYDEIVDETCVVIPTGDGMIIGLRNIGESTFLNSIRVLIDIFEWTKINGYKFRLALHAGDVNVVLDINKKKNLIGNLINDASRIVSAGDSDSIIVSDDYFNKFLRKKECQLGCSYKISESYSFTIVDEGAILDKHTYIHNVFSILIKTSSSEFGNKAPISNNYYTRIYSDDYPKSENLNKVYLKKVVNCSEICFYGIYNMAVPGIVNNISINEFRKLKLTVLYASDTLTLQINDFFNSDIEKLKIQTKMKSIEEVINWHTNHEFKSNIGISILEYNDLPSFGASFVDLNIQGKGFMHISNYIRNVIPDKTPYFEVEWKTKKMPSIYDYYYQYYQMNIITKANLIYKA